MRLEYFEMVDRFTEVNVGERRIKSQSKVPMQSPVFEGHFPGFPLMPGVLMMEVMAQTCGWLVSGITGFTGLPVLAALKEGKVRNIISPGMELETEGHIVHEGSGFAIADGIIRSKGEVMADARLTYRIVPYPSPEFYNTMTSWAERINFPLKDFQK